MRDLVEMSRITANGAKPMMAMTTSSTYASARSRRRAVSRPAHVASDRRRLTRRTSTASAIDATTTITYANDEAYP